MIESLSVLLPNLSILYFLIFVGIILGKFLNVHTLDVSKILIYLIVPVVVFFGTYKLDLSAGNLSVPIILFVLLIFMIFGTFFVLSFFIKDSRKNILSYMSVALNSGFFGLPIALFIFDDNLVNIYIVGILGTNLFTQTIGIYFVARGKFTSTQAFKKVLKIPLGYFAILGFLLNFYKIQIPPYILGFELYFKYGLSLLGMLLIGLGFAHIKKTKLDMNFIVVPTIGQFIVWPLLILGLIYIDKSFIGFLNNDIYKVLMLHSIMPVAASCIAVASLFNFNVEKTAFGLIVNTIIAIFYVPVMIYVLGLYV